MSEVGVNELNEITLVALKEQLSASLKLKGRTICLFSLVDNGRGQFVGTLMDKATSLITRFLIPKEAAMVYGKPVMLGIMKGLLESFEKIVSKNPPNPFNWKKNPIRAMGRACVLEGEIRLDDTTKLELYSWNKIIA